MRRCLPLLLTVLLMGCGDNKLAQLEAENQQLKTKLGQYEPQQPDSLAYKAATVSAGKQLSANDSSISQAQRLSEVLSRQYNTSQEELVNSALYVVDELKKKNVSVSLLEIMESASIYGAVDKTQWKLSKGALAEFLACYAILRQSPGMTHEQATRSAIGLQLAAINLGAKGLPLPR